MPPKQKITKEDILQKAYEITRQYGIDTVTARNVAKEVGCSIQPIFSQFASMEELRQATFHYTSKMMMKEILEHQEEADFMIQTNIWLLNLARNETNLFELLYLSNTYSSTNLWDVMMEWKCNRKMVEAFGEKHHLEESVCKDIFQRGFLLLFGIATMIANNHINLTNEEALDMVSRTVSEMVTGIK